MFGMVFRKQGRNQQRPHPAPTKNKIQKKTCAFSQRSSEFVFMIAMHAHLAVSLREARGERFVILLFELWHSPSPSSSWRALLFLAVQSQERFLRFLALPGLIQLEFRYRFLLKQVKAFLALIFCCFCVCTLVSVRVSVKNGKKLLLGSNLFRYFRTNILAHVSSFDGATYYLLFFYGAWQTKRSNRQKIALAVFENRVREVAPDTPSPRTLCVARYKYATIWNCKSAGSNPDVYAIQFRICRTSCQVYSNA